MVLKDIAMFHNRHRRQPLFKCCNVLNRIKLPKPSLIPETKEKHSATVCVPFGDNPMDQYVLRFFIINVLLNYFF
jgi:hypothetical protein